MAFRTNPDAVLLATMQAMQETTVERDAAQEELTRLTTLRPASEWHEGCSCVLWWPIKDGETTPSEPPVCDSLLASTPPFSFEFDEETGAMHGVYEGYHLFWTPLPKVKAVKP